MYEIFLKLVDLVNGLGYLGIFIMTMIEGTFIPIPNEVTLIPAGYLIASGKFHLAHVLGWAIFGNLAGALINYYIAYHFGRVIVTKYGKYIFFKPEKLIALEKFFHTHGPISVFIGRIMPGIKHVISFPAGLAKMEFKTFCIYTGTGGAIWVIILVILGYLIGSNEEMIQRYLGVINWIALIIAALIITVYVYRYKRKNSAKIYDGGQGKNI